MVVFKSIIYEQTLLQECGDRLQMLRYAWEILNEHGRLIDLTPDWIDVPYPEDVAELLVGGNDSSSINFEADEFSSSSDTSDIEV